jgi:hypothetical protein
MSLEDIRRQLATCARHSGRRFVGDVRRGMPSDWRPRTVIDPETSLPFTEPAAWLLIAELLEEGHELCEVTLDRPPGKKAYELFVDLGGSTSALYIKVHLGANCIVGRSFHNSYRSGLQGTPRSHEHE